MPACMRGLYGCSRASSSALRNSHEHDFALVDTLRDSSQQNKGKPPSRLQQHPKIWMRCPGTCVRVLRSVASPPRSVHAPGTCTLCTLASCIFAGRRHNDASSGDFCALCAKGTARVHREQGLEAVVDKACRTLSPGIRACPRRCPYLAPHPLLSITFSPSRSTPRLARFCRPPFNLQSLLRYSS